MKAILKVDHRPSVAIDCNGDLQIMHNAECLTIEGLDPEQTCLFGHAIVREGQRAEALAKLAEPVLPAR